MNDNNLIRRGDALDVLTDWSLGPEEAIAKMRAVPASPALQEARDKIAALEAEINRMRQALEWVDVNPWAHPDNRWQVVRKGLGLDQ